VRTCLLVDRPGIPFQERPHHLGLFPGEQRSEIDSGRTCRGHTDELNGVQAKQSRAVHTTTSVSWGPVEGDDTPRVYPHGQRLDNSLEDAAIFHGLCA